VEHASLHVPDTSVAVLLSPQQDWCCGHWLLSKHDVGGVGCGGGEGGGCVGIGGAGGGLEGGWLGDGGGGLDAACVADKANFAKFASLQCPYKLHA
jgi:hypothetical protein